MRSALLIFVLFTALGCKKTPSVAEKTEPSNPATRYVEGLAGNVETSRTKVDLHNEKVADRQADYDALLKEQQ